MTKEEKLAIMRKTYPNCPSDQMTAEDDPPVQNASHTVHNIPPDEGEDNMERFTENSIENDTCADAPVLEVPSHKNAEQDNEPKVEFQNCEGDCVPVLGVPVYQPPKKDAKTVKSKAVQNDVDADGAPILHTPTDRRRS